MPALTAVTFDLDDTLYPEREFVRSGYRAVAEWAEGRLGLAAPLVLAELEALFAAGVRREVFDLWLEEKELDPELWVPTMVEIYRGHTPRIRLFPDAQPLFEWLRERRVRLGLVTEGVRGVQQAKIRALGLENAFETVVIGGEDARENWKPSRAPFDTLLAEMTLKAEGTWYLGDNPAKDFRGARATGMLTMRIRRADGLHAGEEPATPNDAADVDVRDLGEAKSVLQAALE
jgi:putative hydrolase of the HAD superfamily